MADLVHHNIHILEFKLLSNINTTCVFRKNLREFTAKDTKLKANVDRISELPDELLCHLLSFLPPNFTYTTRLLSKRWKPLYKLTVDLHFDDKFVKGEEDFQCFRRWVDKVMLSPEMNSQPIRAFHLNCCHSELLFFNHDQWIEAAKLRGVKDLQLSIFHFYTAFKMYMAHSNSLVDKFISVAPNNIFSCRTLVILKLERLCVAGNILSVDLPSLKTLHLKCVYLQNSEDLKKLISESLVLEDLYVMVGYKESASIPPTRVGNGPYHVFFKAIYYNVQFLQLEVRLPNENISSYFKGSNVFPNLIHLELMFVHSYGWDDLMDVLQNCPILEILLIAKIFPKYTKNADDKSSWALKLTSISLTKWKCPNSVPKCISSHLRSCTVTFDGMLDSLRVAKYILQNAPLLQVMTVKSSKSTDSIYQRKCLDELNFCPTISPFCKLSVEWF